MIFENPTKLDRLANSPEEAESELAAAKCLTHAFDTKDIERRIKFISAEIRRIDPSLGY